MLEALPHNTEKSLKLSHCQLTVHDCEVGEKKRNSKG